MSKVDMTYQEIDRVKKEIDEFIEYITDEFFISRGIEFLELDNSFIRTIIKHVIFFKYMLSYNSESHYMNTLVSDFLYLLLSIFEGKKRYIYVNERSIIENYMRLINQMDDVDGQVTLALFEELNERKAEYNVSADEFSYIRSEYSIACGYIHGSEILKSSLSSIFNDCFKDEVTLEVKKELYSSIQRLILVFDKVLVHAMSEYIDSCFHRKKSLLLYLIGEKNTEIIFSKR